MMRPTEEKEEEEEGRWETRRRRGQIQVENSRDDFLKDALLVQFNPVHSELWPPCENLIDNNNNKIIKHG